MESFKIEHFEKENGRGSFVSFRSLPDSEADSLRLRLINALGLEYNCSKLDLVRYVDEISSPLDGVNAEDDEFNLSDLVVSLKLSFDEMIYLNWYQFDQIDEMKITDLSNQFDDIWYPSSDDLNIVSVNLNWIISVHHSGTVSVLSLS